MIALIWSLGFLLAGLALIKYYEWRENRKKLKSKWPQAFKGNWPKNKTEQYDCTENFYHDN